MDKIKKCQSPDIRARLLHLKLFRSGSVLCFIYLLLLFSCEQDDVKVFCIGDSTMSFYDVDKMDEQYGGDGFPRRGWAMELDGFFNDNVEVRNMAVSGRSSKNFRAEGFWEKAKNEFQKGDYLVIQFGHNDEKEEDPNRFTRANFEFKENLMNYAKEAMEAGVHPIIATSIARRRFDENGILVDTHDDYIAAARDAAKELEIPLVDLNLLTTDYIQDKGVEESKKLFLHIKPGAFKNLPDGMTDDTHLSKQGACAVSGLFMEGLSKSKSSLKKYELKNPGDCYSKIE